MKDDVVVERELLHYLDALKMTCLLICMLD